MSVEQAIAGEQENNFYALEIRNFGFSHPKINYNFLKAQDPKSGIFAIYEFGDTVQSKNGFSRHGNGKKQISGLSATSGG